MDIVKCFEEIRYFWWCPGCLALNQCDPHYDEDYVICGECKMKFKTDYESPSRKVAIYLEEKKDSITIEALAENGMPIISPEAIKRDCKMISYPGFKPGHEIFSYKGKELIEFFSIESREEKTDDGVKIIFEQKYRKLY
jgi:hypothetical protein